MCSIWLLTTVFEGCFTNTRKQRIEASCGAIDFAQDPGRRPVCGPPFGLWAQSRVTAVCWDSCTAHAPSSSSSLLALCVRRRLPTRKVMVKRRSHRGVACHSGLFESRVCDAHPHSAARLILTITCMASVVSTRSCWARHRWAAEVRERRELPCPPGGVPTEARQIEVN